MRAIVITEYGGPDVLTLTDIPDPVPGPEEVVVEIVSSAINRADVLQRMGLYPQPGPAPDHEVPGMELAGRVVAMGERVTAWSLGSEVMGIVAGGAYAERIAVHERQLVPVPALVGLHDAGAIPEVWLTAWDALVRQGGLTPGKTALVHAGASGVGTAAIGLCRMIGAKVIVTASAGKVAACRSLGADEAVDYGSEDFVEVCRTATEGRGVDVVLDVIGGDYLARNVQALAVGGTIVQVGVMGGGSATFNLGALLPKRATVRGTVLRGRPIEEKIAVSQQFGREVLPWFASGALKPVIDRRYPLADVAEAHRHMEANANVGKIVLDVSA